MAYATKETNKKREIKTSKLSTTSKTLSLSISTWAQIEQIRSKYGYDSFEQCIAHVFGKAYVDEGFGLA